MKKKLQATFWALGILVLLLSQLIALTPASHAYAATATLDDIQTATYKFSVYAAFHPCLSMVNTSWLGSNSSDFFRGVGGNDTSVIGFAGPDDGSGDGRVYCDQAAALWTTTGGYTSLDDMLKDLGFSISSSTDDNGDTTASVGTSLSHAQLQTKHQEIAKKLSIPISVPPGGRYILAYTAMAKNCSLHIPAAGETHTAPVVSDNFGTIVKKGYYVSWSGAAFPNPDNRGAGDSNCEYLASVLNDPTQGAVALAATMAKTRVDSTAADIAKAACEKAAITNKTKLATCIKDFTGWANACIKDYYAGSVSTSSGASGTSGTIGGTFDVATVTKCIYGKSSGKYKGVTLDDLTNFVQKAMDGNTPASSASGPTEDPCALLPQDTQLRWLACSLLLAGKGMADAFYAAIQSLLYTPVDALFTSQGFKLMGSTFRIIGMALLIIIGLVMIIAQASGSDIVDAYTVKKVLPRIGIALIGIALAWPLLKLTIGATNDMGIALGAFIKNLAGSSTSSAATGSGDIVALIATGLLGGVPAAGKVILGLGGAGFMSLFYTVLLALFIGLAVLAFRQVLIVMLVLIAPLAIAASVMPGTDKLWKFWRTTLLTTLMMFPIITLFLSSGALMASLFGKMDGDKNGNALMAVLVYFAPYFMLPFAFKMAGGLMANIFQIANDKGKGAFDRLRNQRDEIKKDRKKNAGQGHLFAAGGALDRMGMNKAASWALDTRDTAYSTFGGKSPLASQRREAARLNSKRGNAIREHTEKLANALSAFSLNDRAGFALSGVHEQLIDKDPAGNDTADGAKTRAAMQRAGIWGRSIKSVEDIDKMATILADSGNMHNMNAAEQLRAARGTIAGKFKDPEMGRADVATAGMMVAASQGYATPEAIDAYAKRLRADRGPNDTDVSTSLTNRVIGIASGKRGDVRNGYSNVQDKDGNWELGSVDRMGELLLTKTQYSDWTAYKPDTVTAFEPEFVANLGNAERAEATAQILNMLRSGGATGAHKIQADAIYGRLSAAQRAIVDRAPGAPAASGAAATAATAAAAAGAAGAAGAVPPPAPVPPTGTVPRP